MAIQITQGKTLIQSIYDQHYASTALVADYERQWQTLHGRVDEPRYQQVLELLRFQAGHAVVWRDAMNEWFHRTSGIEDAQGRVGHYSGRIEAESMISVGYQPRDVVPWETASGGKAMVCLDASGCSLATQLQQPEGFYRIDVAYYDTWQGVSRFDLRLNGASVAIWKAEDTLPPAQFDPDPDGQTAARFTLHNLYLHLGDRLELRGIPDLRSELIRGTDAASDFREYAIVDYVEIRPETSLHLP